MAIDRLLAGLLVVATLCACVCNSSHVDAPKLQARGEDRHLRSALTPSSSAASSSGSLSSGPMQNTPSAAAPSTAASSSVAGSSLAANAPVANAAAAPASDELQPSAKDMFYGFDDVRVEAASPEGLGSRYLSVMLETASTLLGLSSRSRHRQQSREEAVARASAHAYASSSLMQRIAHRVRRFTSSPLFSNAPAAPPASSGAAGNAPAPAASGADANAEKEKTIIADLPPGVVGIANNGPPPKPVPRGPNVFGQLEP